ncbi:hypothetical protein [Burkholderia cenocepacia]|uniref:hypothetical protein n=1 Tax=Burkholderia cenocepacia TaxID=95486 RepID=UPI0007621893|nr:hypothetical protein [Burkholderia cenocepacia]
MPLTPDGVRDTATSSGWLKPGDTETCPYCAEPGCSAEWVDVGVGMVQAGPFHCEACGAFEIGPYDDTTPSEDERRVGWYSPSRDELPKTVSTLDGKYLDAQTALSMYRRGLVDAVPFRVKSADLLSHMTLAGAPRP